MTRLVETGVVEKLMKKHWPRNSCQNIPSGIEKEKTKVKDTAGAFITLMVGLSTSFLTLIVEIIYDAVKKENFLPRDTKIPLAKGELEGCGSMNESNIKSSYGDF